MAGPEMRIGQGSSVARYVAIDLGAESGRVMVGTFTGGRVVLEETYRFANTPVRVADGLHWDVLRLYGEVLTGLRAVAARHGGELAGIGVDAWGVDFGLLDAGGRLLGNPYHYRDARTDGLPEEAARRVSPAEQYTRTGIAQLPINTLYQLLALARGDDQSLEYARSLVMIPDLLHYWLSGEIAAERTNASTTGVLATDGTWARDLLRRLDIPAHMLLEPKAAGHVLGRLHPMVRQESGLGAAPVILPATHDTACAVVAVPAEPLRAGCRDAYISSGTWSLLGIELERPVLTEGARLAGFTNEAGVGGQYLFHANIMGLWLVQECRRTWARGGLSLGYEELMARAAAVASPSVVIDVDDPAFLHPDDMPAALRRQLARTGQPPVADPPVLARAVLEGLALRYRIALEQAEELTGLRARTVRVVGGGARNSLLCQLTADACRRPVLAGPVEATALGNVLVQAMGTGALRGLSEAREVARASADIRSYEPGATVNWDHRQAYLLARRASADPATGGWTSSSVKPYHNH